MKSIRSTQFTVQTLARQLNEGQFAVPKLQREFVWTGPKATKLLDSIYREMPIGTLVVWKTKSAYETLLRKSLNVLPPFNPRHKHIRFLIDGQQRLSVLYQAAVGREIRNASGTTVDFSRVTFDVVQEELEPDASLFNYRIPVPGHYVSLQELLASNWKQRLSDLPNYKLRRAAKCREAILRFKIPILEVETSDLDEVRELFIRINTQGMRISSADAAFARASEFDLRQRAQELRDQLPQAFRAVPFETILQALAFVQGVKDVGERSYAGLIREWNRALSEDHKAPEEVLPDWNRLRRAFESAVEYLSNEFMVVDETLLPSNNMLATLSVYFFHHAGQPRGAARSEIRKWFWASAVGQRYSGRGFRDNMVKDCTFFEKLARNEYQKFVFTELADPADIRRSEYNRRTSLTDAFFCMLGARRPRFLSNGEPLPDHEAASRANKKNRHHIFPRTRLIGLGRGPRDYNSICNICLISANENLSFGSKLPRVYLDEVRRRRYFSRAMDSHLIPCDADSGLWDSDLSRGFQRFRKARQDLIQAAFEQRAGIRLFRRD